MNRSFTAAAAITAILGTAGLALAQTPTGPANSPANSPAGAAGGAMAPAPGMSPTQPQGMQQAPTAQHPQAAQGTPSQGMPQGTADQGMRAADSQAGPAALSQDQIAQAQQELKAQGLYNGQIDGIIGPQTQTAVSRFQQKNGLPQTAELDQQTLDHLMQSNGGAGQSNR